ncbi:MAG: hypothetical protein IKL86_04490 [Clostridia bacterium]|nr:hypothetical protein [Clostridia bacterium]
MKASNIVRFIFGSGFDANLLKLASKCYTKVGTLSAEYSPTNEPVEFEEKEDLSYRTIKTGQVYLKNVMSAHGSISKDKFQKAPRVRR